MSASLITFSLLMLTAGGIGGPVAGGWSDEVSALSANQLLPPPAPLPFAPEGGVESALGRNRMRSVREARFHLDRAAHDPAWSLDQAPWLHDRVQDILRSNFLKLIREYAEDRLSIDARLDRLRGRSSSLRGDSTGNGPATGMSLRLSPGFYGGSDPGLGMRLGLRAAHRPLLSHTSFEIRRYFASDATMMRLKYARGDRIFSLEHRSGDRRLGDAYLLSVETSF